jgi:phytoene dehydrogenase-like protein
VEPRNGSWDAIVVGSGLGGLACGAYLSAAGLRTLVLEAHAVAGGNSQVFRRSPHGHAYEFDVGVHYIGECAPDGLISRILHGLGLAERIVFRPLDPDGYSTLLYPDLTFRVPASWARYRERLLQTFPAEAEALGQVVDVMRAVATAGRAVQNHELPLSQLGAAHPVFFQWGLKPVTELFRQFGLSQQAGAVLLGEQGDYAVRPSRTPVALAAGLTDHYMRGAFYPEGGGQVIAARLVEAIRAYGGEVWTRAPVERVVVENGRAAGVVLAHGGERLDARFVVSNADLKRTMLELVGPEHFQPATVERVRAFRMSLPLFTVYLGVALDASEAPLPNTNWWIWDGTDLEALYDELEAGRLPDANVAYVGCATRKDPTNVHAAPPGFMNLQIMTLAPAEYAAWNATKGPAEGGRYHRDPVYRERKAALAERLVRVAERVVPGLRERIDWQETATPLTQERFTRSTGGTSYGIEYACDQMGPMRVGPATDVPGLYLCGASAPSGHGIANVLRGGVVAAGAILESDVLRAVCGGEVYGDPGRLPPLRSDWDPWRESQSPARERGARGSRSASSTTTTAP